MKRTYILVPALLALIVTGCAETASPTATASPVPTQVPATPSPEPTEATGGDYTPLADLVPEELNGMPRTEIEGMEAFVGPALAEMGVDPSEAEFLIVAYGEGEDAVALNAIRMPGIDETSMQMFGAMFSGAAGAEVNAQTVTIGGKSVLRMTSPTTVGTVYVYFAEGAVFSIGSESAVLAEQLLAELP
ncbi:MAG TPA: hypothetical protein VMM85_01190 [Methylomirabilota bacterium]|nr:hypothetical protein [Methylomirabilota bacterium]